MALQINTTVTTDEGFTVDNAFGYLNIYILAPQSNWVNINFINLSKIGLKANLP